MTERQRFENQVKSKQSLTENDINTVLISIINRKRFKYTFRDIINYIFRCICFRSKQRLRSNMRQDQSFKKQYIFQKGTKKLSQELDVLNLLKSIRQIKLLTQVILSQKQKLLLRFQRKNLIESSSSSGNSDDYNRYETIKLMESRNPMIRLVIFGKIKRMITSFNKNGERLKTIDRRLLRGLFIR